jgi:hypothetical protein
MKTFTLSLVAIASMTGIALADQRTDSDSSEKEALRMKTPVQTIESRGLEAPSDGIYYGRYGSTRDVEELRRWDEKNG